MSKELTYLQVKKEWAAWVRKRQAGDDSDIVWSDEVSTTKRERNLIRIRRRTPDFVRKAGAFDKPRARYENEPTAKEALDEWADDYAGKHGVFDD